MLWYRCIVNEPWFKSPGLVQWCGETVAQRSVELICSRRGTTDKRLCPTLLHIMWSFACEQLGLRGFRKKMFFWGREAVGVCYDSAYPRKQITLRGIMSNANANNRQTQRSFTRKQWLDNVVDPQMTSFFWFCLFIYSFIFSIVPFLA